MDDHSSEIKKKYQALINKTYGTVTAMIMWLAFGLLLSVPFMSRVWVLALLLILPEAILAAYLIFFVWRCPACHRMLYFELKWPIFSNSCPYCGAKWK